MVEKKSLGSVKRFGVRYGTTVKKRLAAIEEFQKQKQKCIKCLMPKAKRLSMGIYKCEKCGAKFSGAAYFLSEELKQKQTEEEFKEKKTEEPEEE